jgi:hypothetical protein
MENLQITYNYYNWGPFLWSSTLPKDFCEELLVRGKNSKTKHNHHLASNIKDVRKYNEDDIKWLKDSLDFHISCYTGACEKSFGLKTKITDTLVLKNVWINFQKQYELNPEHVHDADFSFVIYLRVSEKLKKEYLQYNGTGPGPGSIYFRYGEASPFSLNYHKFFPEEGTIFMWPSSLAHGVIPYHSNCERISVSGNFLIDRNINT